ncbi:uncharacterized protein LOC124148349 isoform X1 [Haliotis rufescens]|uniref:uncharacterized protein LOC124148349 isoform X1 n=1 Tax=Haliotis rufescens TaxID=6454 RepID=UPI00201F7AEF|nr:uncharacterized protein LOC124148349 isoform X1 [Haliotis rufescens]
MEIRPVPFQVRGGASAISTAILVALLLQEKFKSACSPSTTASGVSPPPLAEQTLNHDFIMVTSKCVIKHVEANNACPHKECGVEVDPDSKVMKILEATLREMFREYSCEYTPPMSLGGDVVKVTILTGDAVVLPYSADLTILQLKDAIKKRFKHDHSKQKLVYNEKVLEVFGRSHKKMTLADYGIEANATIHLLVLLYAIPDDLDHVVFDLHWGYPASAGEDNVDYLDASCFAFKKNIYASVCDFMNESEESSAKKTRFNLMRHVRTDNGCSAAIKHSGDRMDDTNKRGHHTIEVHMKKIPESVSHLIFTLSAFKAPTVSKFPNPTLQFYEASNTNADLCSTSFDRAIHSRAIIMCCVAKDHAGKWQIYDCGAESDGCAAGYLKLVATIKKLMKTGIL